MSPPSKSAPGQQLSRECLETLRAMHQLETKAITAITTAQRRHHTLVERLEAVIATHQEGIDSAAQEVAAAVQAGVDQLGSRTRLAQVLGMSEKELTAILTSRRKANKSVRVREPHTPRSHDAENAA